ncbi:MAG: hypothetical protein GY792_04310 [Gammaproteobacteria bacterium]|nr:hypothetical protein [Gammaproteobacteria bacterium]
MIEKSGSNQPSLATAPITGQAPRAVCSRSGINRLFHCSDCYLPGVVCLYCVCARLTANCSLQHDGMSYGAMDSATDRRSVSI